MFLAVFNKGVLFDIKRCSATDEICFLEARWGGEEGEEGEEGDEGEEGEKGSPSRFGKRFKSADADQSGYPKSRT